MAIIQLNQAEIDYLKFVIEGDVEIIKDEIACWDLVAANTILEKLAKLGYSKRYENPQAEDPSPEGS